MSKKVLVLCQRKSGNLDRGNGKYIKVDEVVVPKINKLVNSLLGPDYTIEYLSNKESYTEEEGGEVDIDLDLVEYNPLAREFIERNISKYDLIILNTCPFMLMNYNIIYKLLKENGLMIFSKYPREDKLEPPKKNENLINLFTDVSSDIGEAIGLNNVTIFKKKLKGGRGKKTKTKNNKNKKSKKTKKTKRNK
jgi:hypothetical protein